MRKLAALWGVVGVLLLLGQAIYRLSLIAIDAFKGAPFSWYHWVALVVCILFMCYAEGYKGFQLKFSPRVVSRARYLSQHATLLQGLLAPFFCMGFFYASRRRMITTWILVTLMIVLVILVKVYTHGQWRGIIDVGVVLGLLWGCISILVYSARVLMGRPFDYPPDLPEEEDTASPE
jgi:hypothetical protein